MNIIFFLSLFLISIPSALSFKNVGNHKIYKTNILSKKKLEIISPKNNIELVKTKKSISKDDFKELNFKEQKDHLCSLLDKNHLYVNLSSLDDNDFNCKEEEKYLTQDFYQSKKNK